MRRLKLIQPRRNSSRNMGSIRMALLAAVGLMTLGIAWAGDEPVLNRLTRVEVQETAKATTIVVTGTAPPKFTVFKLSDPTRLFIDVSNADVSGLSPIQVGNGVVASVAPLQYNDDLVHVGRIIVQLDVDALYKVSAKGNALHIQLDGSKRTSQRPVAAVSAPPSGAVDGQLAARAAEAERRARLAEAEVAAARAQAADAQSALGDVQEMISEAEGRASAAENRASQAENQLTDAQIRAQAAETQLTDAQVRAKAAEIKLTDAQVRAKAAETAATQASQAAQAATQTAAAAQSRAAAADGRADVSDRRAQAATARAEQSDQAAAAAAARAAQSDRAAAEAATRAKAAAIAAKTAEHRAGDMEKKAAAAATRLARARSAASQADARANSAQSDAARAEAKAAEADSRVAAANARAARLEAEKARLASKVEALDRRRADANAEIARLESSQMQLADALASAETDRDEARTRTLQAEQRAQSTALAAEKAQLAQLKSARANSKMDQQLNTLQGNLAKAKAADRSNDVAQLEQRLAALESDADGLRGALASRDAELKTARARADKSRSEANRLERERDQLASTAKRNAAKQKAAKRKAAKRQPVAAKPRQVAAAPKPQPVAAPKARVRTRVTQVEFEDDARGSRIKVRFTGTGDFELKSEGKRTRILEFVNAEIDPAIERSLDTGAFTSAVQLVSSFQAPPPNRRVRIVVTLSDNVKSNVKASKGKLVWHFAEPRARVVASAAQPVAATPAPPTWKPAEVRYEAPRAAAYIGGAAPVASASRSNIVVGRRARYRGRKINIDIKDGDIHNVLRLLAKEGNINIVTSDDVTGTVTIHLKMVPWDEALALVLQSKSLGKQVSGTIWRIAPKEVLASELAIETKIMADREKLRPTNIRLMTVNHARATELMTRVQDVMSSRGKVSVDERTNTLILKDMNEYLDAAEDMIRRLDSQTPQVLIEARIVEVNSSSQREIGIQWGGDALFSAGSGNPTGLLFPSTVGLAGGSDDRLTPALGTASTPNFVVNLPASTGGGSGGALGMTFGTLDNTINLNVRLSALQNEGTVKIVSSPRITTLDNREAVISQGVSIPISQVSATGIQTTFFDAALELKVRPQVTQDGNIYLSLQATNNTPDFQNVGARGDPTILKKEAKTQLLLKDGDTTVIGGIYTSNSGFSRSEVPFFASIPIIGALFRKSLESERRTELLIFVTPRIVNRRAATVRTAQ